MSSGAWYDGLELANNELGLPNQPLVTSPKSAIFHF